MTLRATGLSTVLLGCLQFGGLAIAADGTLRVIVQGKPDVANTLKLLELRVALCQVTQRARGQLPGDVELPSAADLAKVVSWQEETLVDGDWSATFASRGMVIPDLSNGCQIRARYVHTAAVQQRCVQQTAGASESPLLGSAEPAEGETEWSTEKELEPILCRSEKASKRKAKANSSSYVKGRTPTGFPCVWLGNPGNALAPNVAGLHSCVHPSFLTGQFANLGSGGVTLWSVNVPSSSENEAWANWAPDANRGQFQAVLVEEGQPIAKARFSADAVEAFIKQPAWKSLGIKP